MRLMGWSDRSMLDRYGADLAAHRAVEAKRRMGQIAVADHVCPAVWAVTRLLILETGPVTERLRVREIDDDEGRRLVRVTNSTTCTGYPGRDASYRSAMPSNRADRDAQNEGFCAPWRERYARVNIMTLAAVGY